MLCEQVGKGSRVAAIDGLYCLVKKPVFGIRATGRLRRQLLAFARDGVGGEFRGGVFVAQGYDDILPTSDGVGHGRGTAVGGKLQTMDQPSVVETKGPQ